MKTQEKTIKTTFEVYETNADYLILFARDDDGAFFAKADNAEPIAGYVYELKQGASAADLIIDYGSDEAAERCKVDDLDLVIDNKKRYLRTGIEAIEFFALLFPEEADFDTIRRICNSRLIPIEWQDYSKEELFAAFFSTAIYNRSDYDEEIDSAARAAYFVGHATGTLTDVDISKEGDKIHIKLEHTTTDTANSAAISESIIKFFTIDFSYCRSSYEQDGKNEFITLEKL